MDIYADAAVEAAKQIKKGDNIVFSAKIRAEKSLTKFSASLAPEFNFHPCENSLWFNYFAAINMHSPCSR